MRRFLRRTLQIVGATFSFVGALLLIAWAVRGARPALECGVIEAARALDWPVAYACLDKADYDPLIGLVTLIVGVLAWLAARFAPGSNGSVYDPTPEERARNRAALANRVQKTWIDGVLKQSLYEAVLIALGWQPSPESVEMRPWSMKAGRPDEDGTLAPPTAGMAALFDQSEGALLILGEPGSGKTTMLLRLTQELLHRQKAENSHPVPMVFNLSSWQGKEQSIADWLVSELRRFYDMPEQIARHLVDHGELALMLDGLDEVRADVRNECVAAVNTYRSEHLAPVALCCRVAEYRELKTKLVAQLAVTLQPLTPEQQDEYLDNLTLSEASRLKMALDADGALREVAASPLILSVMLGAGEYLRLDEAELTPDRLRSAIWNAYLQNMLSRERKSQAHYPARQVVRQLSWLAGKMLSRSQAVVSIERLNIDWLDHRWQGVIVRLVWGLIVGQIFGLFVGMIWGLFVGMILGPTGGLIFGLIAGSIFGLIMGLIWGMVAQSSTLGTRYSESKPNSGVQRHLSNSTGVSLVAAILCGVFGWALGESINAFAGISWPPAYIAGITILGVAIALEVANIPALYVLHFVLWLKGYTPLNYVRFLDYCTDRILLRKVGGGYIFIHRTFMEHMASIDSTKFDFDTPVGKSKA